MEPVNSVLLEELLVVCLQWDHVLFEVVALDAIDVAHECVADIIRCNVEVERLPLLLGHPHPRLIRVLQGEDPDIVHKSEED